MEDKTRLTLKTAANLLAHGFVIGFVVLLAMIALYMFGGIWAYGIHSKWFHLTYESYCFVMYSIMISLKLMIFFFFGIPWLAIRLTLINKHGQIRWARSSSGSVS